MPGEIFYWIFNMSIAAAVCMLPIFLLRPLRRIPRRIFVWLWLLPFVRMCIPVGIAGKYGLMTLLARFTTRTVTVLETAGGSDVTMMNFLMAANSYFPVTYRVNVLEDLFRIASVIWLAVALAAILTLLILYFVTAGELRDARRFKDNVYFSEKIRTPAVYGILKPRIILPADCRDSDCTYILMHEEAHIRRGDNLIRLLALLAVCVHWFNPLAWLMLKMLYADMELACDEAVLSRCTGEQRKEYARTLLTAAEKTNVFAASFGGARIRLRIENILSYKKLSLFSAAAFSALILAIAYVLLTNAS